MQPEVGWADWLAMEMTFGIDLVPSSPLPSHLFQELVDAYWRLNPNDTREEVEFLLGAEMGLPVNKSGTV